MEMKKRMSIALNPKFVRTSVCLLDTKLNFGVALETFPVPIN
jgi:hypothetical protein